MASEYDDILFGNAGRPPDSMFRPQADDIFSTLLNASMRQQQSQANDALGWAKLGRPTTADIKMMEYQDKLRKREGIAQAALQVQDFLRSPEWELGSLETKRQLYNTRRGELENVIQNVFLDDYEGQLAARAATLDPLDRAFQQYEADSGWSLGQIAGQAGYGLARAVGDLTNLGVNVGGRAASAISGDESYRAGADSIQSGINDVVGDIRSSVRQGGKFQDIDRKIREFTEQGVPIPQLALLTEGYGLDILLDMGIENLPQILPIMGGIRLANGVRMLDGISRGAKVATAAGIMGGAADRNEAVRAFDDLYRSDPMAIESSEMYQELLAETGSPEAARSRLRNMSADIAGVVGAVANGTIGSFGERFLLGSAARKIGQPILSRTLKPAAATILSEGVTGGVEGVGFILGEQAAGINTEPGVSPGLRIAREAVTEAMAAGGLATAGAVTEGVRGTARDNAALDAWFQSDPVGQELARRIDAAPEADRPAMRAAAIQIYNSQMSGEDLELLPNVPPTTATPAGVAGQTAETGEAILNGTPYDPGFTLQGQPYTPTGASPINALPGQAPLGLPQGYVPDFTMTDAAPTPESQRQLTYTQLALPPGELNQQVRQAAWANGRGRQYNEAIRRARTEQERTSASESAAQAYQQEIARQTQQVERHNKNVQDLYNLDSWLGQQTPEYQASSLGQQLRQAIDQGIQALSAERNQLSGQQAPTMDALPAIETETAIAEETVPDAINTAIETPVEEEFVDNFEEGFDAAITDIAGRLENLERQFFNAGDTATTQQTGQALDDLYRDLNNQMQRNDLDYDTRDELFRLRNELDSLAGDFNDSVRQNIPAATVAAPSVIAEDVATEPVAETVAEDIIAAPPTEPDITTEAGMQENVQEEAINTLTAFLSNYNQLLEAGVEAQTPAEQQEITSAMEVLRNGINTILDSGLIPADRANTIRALIEPAAPPPVTPSPNPAPVPRPARVQTEPSARTPKESVIQQALRNVVRLARDYPLLLEELNNNRMRSDPRARKATNLLNNRVRKYLQALESWPEETIQGQRRLIESLQAITVDLENFIQNPVYNLNGRVIGNPLTVSFALPEGLTDGRRANRTGRSNQTVEPVEASAAVGNEQAGRADLTETAAASTADGSLGAGQQGVSATGQAETNARNFRRQTGAGTGTVSGTGSGVPATADAGSAQGQGSPADQGSGRADNAATAESLGAGEQGGIISRLQAFPELDSRLGAENYNQLSTGLSRIADNFTRLFNDSGTAITGQELMELYPLSVDVTDTGIVSSEFSPEEGVMITIDSRNDGTPSQPMEIMRTIVHEYTHALNDVFAESGAMQQYAALIQEAIRTNTDPGFTFNSPDSFDGWATAPNDQQVKNQVSWQAATRGQQIQLKNEIRNIDYVYTPGELLAFAVEQKFSGQEGIYTDYLNRRLADISRFAGLDTSQVSLWNPENDLFQSPEFNQLWEGMNEPATDTEAMPSLPGETGTGSDNGPTPGSGTTPRSYRRLGTPERSGDNLGSVGETIEDGSTLQYEPGGTENLATQASDMQDTADIPAPENEIVSDAEVFAGYNAQANSVPMPDYADATIPDEAVADSINEAIAEGVVEGRPRATPRSEFIPDESQVADSFLRANLDAETQAFVAQGDQYARTYMPSPNSPSFEMSRGIRLGQKAKTLFVDAAAPFVDWLEQHGGNMRQELIDTFRLMKGTTTALQNDLIRAIREPFDTHIKSMMDASGVDPVVLYTWVGDYANIRHGLHEADAAHENSLQLAVDEAQAAMDELYTTNKRVQRWQARIDAAEARLDGDIDPVLRTQINQTIRLLRNTPPRKLKKARSARNAAQNKLDRYRRWYNARPIDNDIYQQYLQNQMADIEAQLETTEDEATLRRLNRQRLNVEREIAKFAQDLEDGIRRFESAEDAEARASGEAVSNSGVNALPREATATGRNMGEEQARQEEILNNLTESLNGDRAQAEQMLDEGADRVVRGFREILNRRLAARLVTMDDYNDFYPFNYFVSLMTERSQQVAENETLDAKIYNVRRIDYARQGMTTPALPSSSTLMAMINRTATEIGGNQFRQNLDTLGQRLEREGESYGLRSYSLDTLERQAQSDNIEDRRESTRINDAPGYIVSRVVTDGEGKQRIRRVKWTYEFSTDPEVNSENARLRKAMSTTPARQGEYVQPALRGMANTTRLFGQMFTKYRPTFSFLTALRDIVERGVNILGVNLTTQDGRTITGTDVTARMASLLTNSEVTGAYFNGQHGRPNVGKFANYWQEFTSGDLGYSWNRLVRLIREQQFSGENLRQQEWFKGYDQVNKTLRTGMKSLQRADDLINQWNDNFNAYPAFVQYVALRELGVADGTAGAQVLDLMNLHQAGELAPFGQAVWPFFRPIMQGGYNMLRAMGLTPRTFNPSGTLQGFFTGPQWRGRVALMGGMMASYMLAGLLRGMAGDDPETGINRMDAVPLTTIARGIPLPVGDGYLLAPVGFGLSQFAHMGGWTFDRLQRGAVTPGDAFANLTSTFFKNVAPSSMPGYAFDENPAAWLFHAFTPAPLVPVTEFAMNKSFYGNMIYQDAPGVGVRDFESGFMRTPEVWRRWARAFYEYSGGLIDVTPETIRHFMTNGLPGALSSISGFVTADDVASNPNHRSTREELGPFLYMMGLSSFYDRGPQVNQATFFRAKTQIEQTLTRNGVRVTDPNNVGSPEKKAAFIRRGVMQAGLDPKLADAYLAVLETERQRTKLNKDFRRSSEQLRTRDDSVEALRQPYERYYQQLDQIFANGVRRLPDYSELW